MIEKLNVHVEYRPLGGCDGFCGYVGALKNRMTGRTAEEVIRCRNAHREHLLDWVGHTRPQGCRFRKIDIRDENEVHPTIRRVARGRKD